jgi:TonB-dependent receptor
MRFGKSSAKNPLLRLAILGSVAFGGMSALAQQQPQQPASAPAAAADPEAEIVVTASRPLAESEAAALLVQRESPNLVSVLAADAIGRLPDQNIAFAIGRLPGIGLERDQGQARYVNLRGSPNRWVTLSFDGLSVVSPEGRSTRFDNIPSALAKQVVVSKAITPDMPGDTVAGNVDIKTRSALDYKGFNAFGNVALGYVTLGGGEENDVSAVVSDRFLDGRLGVLVQGSYYRRNMVTDNWETDPYLAPGSSGTPATPGQRFAREHENKPYRLTRENFSASFKADYDLSDTDRLTFSAIWTRYQDQELRNNYIFRFDEGFGPTGTTRGPSQTPGNTPLFGTTFATRIDVNTNSLDSIEDSYINTLGGEHAFAGWDVSWRANYTYTSDGRDAESTPNFQSPSDPVLRPTVEYDFRDGDNNTVRLFRTVIGGTTAAPTRARGAAVGQIEDFALPLTNISRRDGADETQAYTLKGDVSRTFDGVLGGDLLIKAGALWTDRTKKSNEESRTATAAQITAAGLPVPTTSTFALQRPYLGEYALGYAFRYHSRDAQNRYMSDLIARGIATRNNTSTAFWRVSEELLAGYGMGRITRDNWNVTAGLRVEQIKNVGTATGTVGGVARPLNTDSEETLYYPSAHLNIDVTEQVKLRFGATQTASRADFGQIRPSLTVNDATRTISGGNPDAKPEKQTGFDAYVEWYMEPEGFISAGLFYKDISDFLYTSADVYGQSDLNEPGFDRSGYTLSAIRNGGDGYLRGFEVFASKTAENLVANAGLPEWLGGFGLRGSATWVDSELSIPQVLTRTFVPATGQFTTAVTTPERKVKLPGTSDYVYNLQATYEKYDLSVRLAYQVRSAFRQSIGGYVVVAGQVVPNGNGDVYWDKDDELDLSVRYRLNDNLEWYFDAVNLLDGPGRRYADTPDKPVEYETFGERYIMGVRFNF